MFRAYKMCIWCLTRSLIYLVWTQEINLRFNSCNEWREARKVSSGIYQIFTVYPLCLWRWPTHTHNSQMEAGSCSFIHHALCLDSWNGDKTCLNSSRLQILRQLQYINKRHRLSHFSSAGRPSYGLRTNSSPAVEVRGLQGKMSTEAG